MAIILIGGDIYPAGHIKESFINGNADFIFNNLLDDITQADLSIVNLECPLIAKESPIIKAGPVLGADMQCIKGFVNAKWDLVNLANNHTFDHGVLGLQETMTTIKKAGLSCIGAGSNIDEAQMPFIKEINGERIVVYSMAEREFSVADKNTPGANPLDLINFVGAVQCHKQQGIFIVLIHGGKEFYPYPSPEAVRRSRFMVDMGADAVIYCHTHCPLPWETYLSKPIVYGLGNLIFEPLWKPPASFYEGYLAKLTVNDENIQFEAIPYFQSQTAPGARKMNETVKKCFFREMEIKNTNLKNISFLESEWIKYCLTQKNYYLAGLFGYNKIMRKISRFLLPLLHSKEERYQALHLVQCETHQEILNTIFKNERDNS